MFTPIVKTEDGERGVIKLGPIKFQKGKGNFPKKVPEELLNEVVTVMDLADWWEGLQTIVEGYDLSEKQTVMLIKRIRLSTKTSVREAKSTQDTAVEGMEQGAER